MIYRGFILAIAITLAGCALDPQGGYRPMAEAPSHKEFNDANAEAWVTAYSQLGGNAMDSAYTRQYDATMHSAGWEHPWMPARGWEMPARPQPSTASGDQ